MSLLAPIYFLGGLAIVAPILFHLIRRQTRNRVSFSSLMFLDEARPKQTRRSRIENWPLLLLRCIALLVLAFAFSRPFFRQAGLIDAAVPGRHVVMMIDTSASLRRAGAWPRTLEIANSVIDDLAANDQVSLIGFDQAADVMVSGSTDRLLLRAELDRLSPSWAKTDWDAALVMAADVIAETRMRNSSVPDQPVQREQAVQVVLISDMQRGFDFAKLNQQVWPADVPVDVRRVRVKPVANASLTVVPPATDSSVGDAGPAELMVRIAHWSEDDQANGTFELAWLDESTGRRFGALTTQVPANQVRTVRMTQTSDQCVCLELRGDDCDFDNRHYIAPPSRLSRRCLVLAGGAGDPRDRPDFYLRNVPLNRPGTAVEIDTLPSLPSETIDAAATPLIVVTQPMGPPDASRLRSVMTDGATVLVVLSSDDVGTDADDGPAWQMTLDELASGTSDTGVATGVADEPSDLTRLTVGETTDEPARLSRIDFANPLFATLAAPQFNDFSKMSFWRHRLVQTTGSAWSTAASFDDDSPAIVSRPVGAGRLWVLTSGWQPKESQLALSTKFIPLMHAWFWRAGGLSDSESSRRSAQWFVGDRLPGDDPAVSIVTQPGLRPGLTGDPSQMLAVNLHPSESDTRAVPADELERFGLTLGKVASAESLDDARRQLLSAELEQRQSVWRWLLLAGLCLLILETAAAGFPRSRSSDAVTT